MDDAQDHIGQNLSRFFFKLYFEGKVQGSFSSEKDTHVPPRRVRKPDMGYMNPRQAYEAANDGHPMSEFLIEVVSKNDKANYYADKIEEYFQAGAKVVWLVYPKQKSVHVYTADQRMVICKGEKICSAVPVLPEFALPAKDVFAKPAKPAQ